MIAPAAPAAPRVTVLVPMRDASGTIDECLDSVAAQSEERHEALVVDDGSRDDGPERVAARARVDARVRLVRASGRGLVPALNEGLALARAPAVARLDADDRMHPRRLERQLRFLAAHLRTAIVGSRVRPFPDDRPGAGMVEYLRWQNACLSPRSLVDELYVEATIAHPSATFRRDVVRAAGGYREGDFPEDYELLLRLVRAGAGLGKCPEVLTDWRQRPDSLSRRDPRYARAAFDALRAEYLDRDPRLRGPRPVAFWGAGRRTRLRARAVTARGISPIAWIDVDPRKLGNRLAGVPVVPPAWLVDRAGAAAPFVLVWVAAHGAREQIGARLERLGYRRGRDWLAVG